MERVSLYEELRLIERSESEVNGAWKGAHILLFFLAFVFGSFCTFCFHMLMYLFDEKCVLFPKLLSLTSLRHNVIYEFIPDEKERIDMLPVDFLSTQWVEKSACYLPTYVPLISGIFGLVWTTMFLMCSTGSRTLTGLQRPWRIIPPVFIFSIAMSCLCIYSSTVTHNGLRDLCLKLGEITGSSTCSYTVNVATLVYERKIRGVYQATRLTITSAWLHTGCWLASALLALVRILLAVDFRLVKVQVELIGNIDKMLERNEQHLRTVSPNDEDITNQSTSVTNTELFYRNEQYYSELKDTQSDIMYISELSAPGSKMSLVPEERHKLAKIKLYQLVRKDQEFIVNILFDLLDKIDYTAPEDLQQSSTSITSSMEDIATITRQLGQQKISSKASLTGDSLNETASTDDVLEVQNEIKTQLQKTLNRQLLELPVHEHASLTSMIDDAPSTSRKQTTFESTMNITTEMRRALEEKMKLALSSEKAEKKSNLKNIAVQTDKKKRKPSTHRVKISESKSTYIDTDPSQSSSSGKAETSTTSNVSKKKRKEKQD